jgi:hypothetical protein
MSFFRQRKPILQMLRSGPIAKRVAGGGLPPAWIDIPTIRAKFNTYRFAGYKPVVIDLLHRVTRVSVETMAITEAMKVAPRG